MFFIVLSALIRDFLIFSGQSCADIEKSYMLTLWFLLSDHMPTLISTDHTFWWFGKSSPHIKLNNECAFAEWFSYSLCPSLASLFLNMHQVASQTHFQECQLRKQVDWFGSSCKFFFFVICVRHQFVAVGWAFTAAWVNVQPPLHCMRVWQHTFHIFLWRRSILFANSGTTWKVGGRAMDIGAECESLLWVSLLLVCYLLTQEQLEINTSTGYADQNVPKINNYYIHRYLFQPQWWGGRVTIHLERQVCFFFWQAPVLFLFLSVDKYGC
jgi:hypothetical protein